MRKTLDTTGLTLSLWPLAGRSSGTLLPIVAPEVVEVAALPPQSAEHAAARRQQRARLLRRRGGDHLGPDGDLDLLQRTNNTMPLESIMDRK